MSGKFGHGFLAQLPIFMWLVTSLPKQNIFAATEY